jgi:malonyl-CoA O-methyltransferase
MDIKQKIKKCFDAAALTYNEAAFVQSQAGIELIQKLNKINLAPNAIADIGSGTGYLAKQLAIKYSDSSITCIDFSKNINYINADFDSLPFLSESMDLACSNFALQWSLNLPQTFLELSRILKPEGYLIFSTLGPSTLSELNKCWQKIDSDNHVNQYCSLESIKEHLEANKIKIIELSSKIMTMYFPSVIDVLRNLKSVGANHVINKKSKSLMSRKNLNKLIEHYEHYRNHINLLPVTYEVIYVTAIK